uniref:Uncharacterized protein n=1 Tax=Pithovirus LCPAC404 TaxID=2506597 RepID=A0A481ZCR4_9VIRU|nr:MAG: hypothetical protein LCPAC404_01700 [Pithovirus LCPAC404]
MVLPAYSQVFVVNEEVPVTCFSIDFSGGPPVKTFYDAPCIQPTGLPADVQPGSVTGEAEIKVRDDDTAKIEIKLEGLNENLVITALVTYFFPPGDGSEDDIFKDGTAGQSYPLAATTAAYTEGMAPEPNSFIYDSASTATLLVELDYNPLLANQGPLRNTLTALTQEGGTGDAAQPGCCPSGPPPPATIFQPIGAASLRQFDANGFQTLDANGIPVLVRSPDRVAGIVIIAHIDKNTHGVFSGVPIFPLDPEQPPGAPGPLPPGVLAASGDHYLVGIVDLRDIEMPA